MAAEDQIVEGDFLPRGPEWTVMAPILDLFTNSDMFSPRTREWADRVRRRFTPVQNVYPEPLSTKEDAFVRKLLQRRHRTFAKKLYEILDDEKKHRKYTDELHSHNNNDGPRLHYFQFAYGDVCRNTASGVFRLECDRIIVYLRVLKPPADDFFWDKTIYKRVIWDRRRGCITCVDIYSRFYNEVHETVSIPLLERAMRRYRERRAVLVQKAVGKYLPLDLAVMVGHCIREPDDDSGAKTASPVSVFWDPKTLLPISPS